jgi:(S)-2-hydroxyglutarate dehydrogenase
MERENCNIGVVGGGIIGLSIAYKLQLKYPKSKITLFEKESKVGLHQSGRNSGVLHCGLHYQPGSLKAKLAVSGIDQMTKFCKVHKIPHDICGKIVVASDERQLPFLEELANRGHKNGLQNLTFLNKTQLNEREPYVSAKKALLVPQEGIVDYKSVMQKMEELIMINRGEIVYSTKISSAKNFNDSVIISDGKNEWNFDFIFSCGGLYSDKNYSNFTGKNRPLRIIPFRGEYLMLKPEARKFVNHLIYPVPDPKYPFLGVHFTRLVNGEREVGPNAVFAFKREGYKNTDISIAELYDSLSYKGFRKFAINNFSFCLNELKGSLMMSEFIRKAQKLIPEINSSFLEKGTAGVRAQAMNDTGKLVMDFNVIRDGNQIHVLNAPSPGATASLSIADHIINNYFE